MGWSFGYSWIKRNQMIDDLETELRVNRYTIQGSHSAKRGQVQYWALQHVDTGATLMAIYLCKFDRHDRCWGYKAMTESMGPVESECPLRLLALTKGDGSESSRKWRERCENYAKRKAVEYFPGDKVLVYGKPYTVSGFKGRSYLIKDVSGKQYRCAPEKMNKVNDSKIAI